MKIIVDTNIVFNAILNTNSQIGDLLLNSFETFEFYSASYLKLEIEKHTPRLQRISKLDLSSLEESKFLILSRISFITEEQIPYSFWHESVQLVRDVDMDDIAFVALSKYMGDIKLWTGDKVLMNGLISKGFKNCINTQELIILRELLEGKEKKTTDNK